MQVSRRGFLGMSAVALMACTGAVEAPAKSIRVYRSPSCGCCGGWVDHLRASGFEVAVEMVDDLDPIATRLSIPDAVRSCHTGEIGGYFVEGHVPAPDIEKLLRERPSAAGIAVPGMPMGAPGMEMGSHRQSYQTLLVDRSGGTRVFAQH